MWGGVQACGGHLERVCAWGGAAVSGDAPAELCPEALAKLRRSPAERIFRFALVPIFASKIQKNTLVCAVNRKKSAYLHRTYKTSLASSMDLQRDVNLLV